MEAEIHLRIAAPTARYGCELAAITRVEARIAAGYIAREEGARAMPLNTKRRFLISLQLGSIYLLDAANLRLAQRHVWRKAARLRSVAGFSPMPRVNAW